MDFHLEFHANCESDTKYFDLRIGYMPYNLKWWHFYSCQNGKELHIETRFFSLSFYTKTQN